MVVFFYRDEIELDAVTKLREICGKRTDGRNVNEKRAAVVFNTPMGKGVADALLKMLEARIDLLRVLIGINVDQCLEFFAPRRGKKRFQGAIA